MGQTFAVGQSRPTIRNFRIVATPLQFVLLENILFNGCHTSRNLHYLQTLNSPVVHNLHGHAAMLGRFFVLDDLAMQICEHRMPQRIFRK
jgi:hypothetical protein